MNKVADPFGRWELTPIINAAGTMTSLGASRVHPQIIELVSEILASFVAIDELQAKASEVIAKATGAEAGCVTDCSAAAMVQCVAATVTGSDIAAIEALPDTGPRECHVALQTGHMINYGAPIHQAIALSGAIPRPVGTAARCETYHLKRALDAGCVAALFVVSHHTVREGELPLEIFAEICASYGVPVIVDMASEYDLRTPIALGADLVIYSGHKFLGGPTSGIVAGNSDLIRSVYLQHLGIGRCMKVGKEGIAGAMAALEVWGGRDAAAIKARELQIVDAWQTSLEAIEGLTCARHDDWTDNPITRLRIKIDPLKTGLYAWELAGRLASRRPQIHVRDDLVEFGEIYLDPCNLSLEEAELVTEALDQEIAGARTRQDGCRISWSDVKRMRENAILSWPGKDMKNGSA